jgi:Na+/H+ antiporter NhaD/arsenite permease-like protein
MASNIGGAATLIGDPPNILIGSAARLSFTEFVVHLTPVVLLTLPPVLGVLYLMFRRQLWYTKEAEDVIAGMDAAGSIRDGVLLRKSLIVLGLVIIAFFLHGALHLEAATIALFGAAALSHRIYRRHSGATHKRQWRCLRRHGDHSYLGQWDSFGDRGQHPLHGDYDPGDPRPG